MTGSETGFKLVISRAVLDADYVINIPVFKTHLVMMVTGAIKNTFGYVAGACKARLHLNASTEELFARTICDIHQVRPPDLNIMDAITAIEGNGPCHGGHLRKVSKLLASTDSLALDAVMARMMGVDPAQLPVQKQAMERGLGTLNETEIDIEGELVTIPDFKMPVTYIPLPAQEGTDGEKTLEPPEWMRTRLTIKPEYHEDKCVRCQDCVINCPAQALTIEPEFFINDKCINCYCCVELCPEGALAVPDVEAFHYY
jgi:ferredoxin